MLGCSFGSRLKIKKERMMKNLKMKCFTILVAVITIFPMISSSAMAVYANEVVHQDVVTSETYVSSFEPHFGLSEEILRRARNNELSDDEQALLLNNMIAPVGEDRSISISAVIGIAIGAITLGKANYELGRYVARQCEIRLGMTKAVYLGMAPMLRGQLARTISPLGALGFDDYFMGV
ncbi:Uncharacterised protein [Streptococcus acidominimus]|uniref:Uncharacterized protein n=2 Tax=Streptococcus acidominimus TaxID=1326 RepID=A0A380IHT4_STRAI|nr:Uncharacterised protein [Streptococcus acidominimus]